MSDTHWPDQYVPEPGVLRSFERVDDTQNIKDLNAQIEYLRQCLRRQENQVDTLLRIVDELSGRRDR